MGPKHDLWYRLGLIPPGYFLPEKLLVQPRTYNVSEAIRDELRQVDSKRSRGRCVICHLLLHLRHFHPAVTLWWVFFFRLMPRIVAATDRYYTGRHTFLSICKQHKQYS